MYITEIACATHHMDGGIVKLWQNLLLSAQIEPELNLNVHH